MLLLLLRRMPVTVLGVYGAEGTPLPKRMRLLHPRASYAFEDANRAANGGLVCSDMYRSAESSLEAVQTGRGAQPPGYSGHNYGYSIDLAIDKVLNATRMTYETLLRFMEGFGWYCYRRDGQRGREDWHFNYLGDHAGEIVPRLVQGRWEQGAEGIIQVTYGPQFKLDPVGVQTCLQRLKLYRGELDGELGPLTRQAAGAFGRAWAVQATDFTNVRFQRTLAFVAAQYEIEELPTG